MKNFTLKTIIGFIARLIIVLPFALLLVNLGEYSSINNNISVFVLIILGAATVLYLGIMTFVPAEYAIKTSIHIIEFHMWKPQIVSVFVSATVTLGLALVTAAFAFYTTAVILFLYALSLYMWPKYIKKIDGASKEHMLATLKS